MNKKKIIKHELGFLKREGFKLRYKRYAKKIDLFLFYKANNPSIKIMITENISNKYIDLKIRGSNHQILFFYEWNQLMANAYFENIDELIREINKVYQNKDYTILDFQKIIIIYANIIKKNLKIILKES